jgi:hypothetical protein
MPRRRATFTTRRRPVARFGRRRRQVFRRRPPRSSRGGASSIGIGQLAINCVRRMLLAPFQQPPGQSTGTNPWVVGLTTVLTLVMKVVSSAYQKPSSNDWISIQIGRAGCWGLTIDDLIWSSPLVHNYSVNDDPRGDPRRGCGFSQGRVSWIRAVLTPMVDTSLRGGNFSAALVSISDIDEIRTLSQDRDAAITFEEIANMPGAVIAPATRPIVLNWRPLSNSWSAGWHEIGHSTSVDTVVPSDRTSLPLAKLHLHYRDFASKNMTGEDQYVTSRCIFEITFESHVQFRNPRGGLAPASGDLHVLRNFPWELSNGTTTTVVTANGRYEAKPELFTVRDSELYLNMDALVGRAALTPIAHSPTASEMQFEVP